MKDCKLTPQAVDAHFRRPILSINVTIRNMIRADFDYAAEIMRQAFNQPRGDAASMKEDLDVFRRLYAMRGPVLRVAEVDGIPVAYLVALRHDEAYEICQVAVLPNLQLRGIGGLLVDDLKRRLGGRGNRRTRLIAAIPDSNVTAYCFFYGVGFRGPVGVSRKCGSEATDYLRDYCFDVAGWVADRRKMMKGGKS